MIYLPAGAISNLNRSVREGFPDKSTGCVTFAFMMNKQEDADVTTTAQPANMLEEYNTSATNIHYILHNLFRL